jgi:LPXTG-motif cell wall-anchored protein
LLLAHSEPLVHLHVGEIVVYALPVIGAAALGLGGLLIYRWKLARKGDKNES